MGHASINEASFVFFVRGLVGMASVSSCKAEARLKVQCLILIKSDWIVWNLATRSQADEAVVAGGGNRDGHLLDGGIAGNGSRDNRDAASAMNGRRPRR